MSYIGYDGGSLYALVQALRGKPRMWHEVKLWGFLAGLGLFLLGMYMLEQGLRGLGSRSMKKLLREQTRSPLRGVIGPLYRVHPGPFWQPIFSAFFQI